MSHENLTQMEDQLHAIGRKLEEDVAGLARHPQQSSMPEWSGADTVVTSDFMYESGGFKTDLIVRTRHARILTWLIFEIRDAFSEFLDATNKYDFYGSLGEAALKHLARHQPEAEDHRSLLRAVFAKAFEYFAYVQEHHTLPPDSPIVLHSQDAEGRQFREGFDAGDADDDEE